jgi:hypothetical protein
MDSLRVTTWSGAAGWEKLVAMPRASRNALPVRRFLQIMFLLLLLTAGIGGRYLYNRGLTKSWREFVVKEVRKHGVEVSFSRLTVRPFRGLVAKDVKFFDGPARNRIVAQMNEMVVEANYANAVKGEPFLDALTLVDTNLRFPLDPNNPFGPSLGVEKLNARVLFPPNQIHLTRLDATVLGIRVNASGSLVIPPGLSISPDRGGANADLWTTIVRELGTLRFEGAQPSLTVQFSGDLSRPDEILVETEFDADMVRRGSYVLSSLHAGATWKNGMLVLSRFEAADSRGQLQASGSFEPKSRAGELRVRSGLDLAAILREMNVASAEGFELKSAPQLDLTARMQSAATPDARPQFHILGHVRLGKFTYGKVSFDGMHGDVSWDGRRWAVRDLVVRQANGAELTGDAQQDYDEFGNGDFRLGLKSNLSPAAVVPLLSREAAATLAQIKFHEAPRLSVSARGSSPGLDTLSASGELRLGRTVFRGVEAKGFRTSFRYNARVLTLDSFDLSRAEGTGSGSLVVDLKSNLIRFNGVKTTLNPTEAATWIGQDLVNDVKAYRFTKRPPLLLIDGVLDPVKGGTRTRLNVIADAPGGMDYNLCGKDLSFGAAKGKLFFTDELLKLRDVRAELFGGMVTGEADVSLLKNKPGHSAKARVEGVDFASISKVYFDYSDSKGKLDGSCNFTGKRDDAMALRGEGEVSVTEGNVFAIPFLGPLSNILNKVVPGMGYSRARKATASFSMGDGIVSTRNFVVEGNGFSMYGDGRIWMVQDKIDFDARINAKGIPGVVLFPVSKLLEYRADSRFSQPDWRPKVVPRLGGGGDKQRAE